MSFDLYLLYRRCAKGLTFVEMQSQAAQARKNGKKQLQSGKKGEEEKASKQKAARRKKRQQKEQVSPQAKIHKRIQASIRAHKKSRGLRKPQCREPKKEGQASRSLDTAMPLCYNSCIKHP